MDVGSIQETVATLSDSSKQRFQSAMVGLSSVASRARRAGDAVDGDLQQGWSAMLSEPTLAKELNAVGVDVRRVATAANVSLQSVDSECGNECTAAHRRGYRLP